MMLSTFQFTRLCPLALDVSEADSGKASETREESVNLTREGALRDRLAHRAASMLQSWRSVLSGVGGLSLVLFTSYASRVT